MAGIVVKPRARILHGHDWVFSSEVLKVFGNPADGDVISLKDGKDHLIGSALYNSKSQSVARRFSRRRVERQLCRVGGSESDVLPGVVIDRYGEHFVLQTLTLAMDMRKELIAHAIVDLFEAKNIIERNDAPVRQVEGLEARTGILSGAATSKIRIDINDIKFDVDLLHGQKTGFYLDQKDNYGIIAQYARGRRVVDCFTSQGAFALACARADASEVTGIEANTESLEAARENAERNQLRVQWIGQDV